MSPQRRRVVTRHMTERTALAKFGRLLHWQQLVSEGRPTSASRARERLAAYDLDENSELHVRHERKMAFKWAVVTPDRAPSS